jgi:hypothetical protein
MKFDGEPETVSKGGVIAKVHGTGGRRYRRCTCPFLATAWHEMIDGERDQNRELVS